MALELVGGAVLGVLFDQFQKEIGRVKDNYKTFKPKLEELEETLTVLYPVIEEIEELNRRLNRPNHVTIKLRGLLEEGTKLVSKCSKIPRWDILKQGRYRQKLVELDNKILRFHILYLQAHMGRDQVQTLLFVKETKQMMIMSLNQQGFSNLTVGFTDSSDLSTTASSSTAGLSSNTTVCITITMRTSPSSSTIIGFHYPGAFTCMTGSDLIPGMGWHARSLIRGIGWHDERSLIPGMGWRGSSLARGMGWRSFPRIELKPLQNPYGSS